MQPLLELGYDVVGCDPSPEMLQAAAAKLPHGIPLLVGGLPRIPAPGLFDYVTCLNDVLNYVAPEDLQPGLTALAGALKRGGVLVADTSTLATYREFFARDHVRSRGGHVFAWTAATAPDAPAGSLSRAWLDIFTRSRDGRYDRLGAEQLQQHHPEPVMEAAIEAAGLNLVGLYGQRDDGLMEQQLEPTRHTKCIWVAHKP